MQTSPQSRTADSGSRLRDGWIDKGGVGKLDGVIELNCLTRHSCDGLQKISTIGYCTAWAECMRADFDSSFLIEHTRRMAVADRHAQLCSSSKHRAEKPTQARRSENLHRGRQCAGLPTARFLAGKSEPTINPDL